MTKLAISKSGTYEYSSSKISIKEVNPKNLDVKTLLNASSLIMFDKKTKRVIFETSAVYPQHFYPLSILDYANAIKKMILEGEEKLPILSVSSKDYPYCDFNCKDCLAIPTRNWAIKEKKEKVIEIERYKKILKQISEYSKKIGIDSVRFEICGEGNPDLYKNRVEMINYAKEECNMGLVYISTGSKLSDELKETLVKNASYIRISFPGISTEAYKFYSEQPQLNEFAYSDAINLLRELLHLRKVYNREDKLLIGVRTCMRKLNNGYYYDFAKTIGKMGVDSFQVVKVLTDNKEIIIKNSLDENTKNEIIKLKESYKKLGLKHLQIPNILDKLYIDRTLDNLKRPSKCYSSMISPILYGSDLIVCIHWDKVRNSEEYYYGTMVGEKDECEKLIYGEKGEKIRSKIPNNCKDCCSMNDNLLLEAIRSQLSLYSNLDDIDFALTLEEDYNEKINL